MLSTLRRLLTGSADAAAPLPAPPVRASATRSATEPTPGAPHHAPDSGLGYLVDASTRTYWRPGAARSETLVDAPEPTSTESIGQRVAELLSARNQRVRDRSQADVARTAGAADPAFLEVLMVELLRAASFERAFSLLAPDCQRRWESSSRFAAEHAALPRLLGGVEVVEERRLGCWSDPEWERAHWDVAELEVEYRLGEGELARSVRRVVHLVRFDGRWRYLLYPRRQPTAIAG